MTGLENISANNGWTMALLGSSIVFSGLVILSFTISQLHKILDLWDNRASFLEKLKNTPSEEPARDEGEMHFSDEITETIRNFKLLTQRIGDPFALPKLLDMAVKRGLAKPHASVNRLLQQKIIIPDGKGYFIWKN